MYFSITWVIGTPTPGENSHVACNTEKSGWHGMNTYSCHKKSDRHYSQVISSWPKGRHKHPELGVKPREIRQPNHKRPFRC